MKYASKIILKAGIIALASLYMTGCAHWTNINEVPDYSEKVTRNDQRIPSEIPAAFTRLKVLSNGIEVNTSEGFKTRFIDNIKDTGLFSLVSTDIPNPKPEKLVELTLVVKEKSDAHTGAAATKGFFIGLSLFLLTPVLPLRYDFESEMQLKATRSDGASKTYIAKSGGNAKWHLFANAAQAGQEIGGLVTQNCINSLMNQMTQDKMFFENK